MKFQYTLIGLFVVILLGVTTNGQSNTTSITEAPVTTTTVTETPATTTTVTETPATTTTVTETPVTTTTVTPPSTSPVARSSTTSAEASTNTDSTTSEPMVSSTASSEPSTTPATTASPGRKFDGLSFMGGMILVLGLGALTFLVVRHLRRTNSLPYANLR